MTSLWLAEIDGQGEAQPELTGDVRADVAIVGGGFVGLWTAIHLRLLDPSCDVVVLEKGRCGHGASGLNGGFVMSWWPKIASLQKICGAEDAVWLADQTSEAVRDLGPFLDAHRIDAEFVRAGWLWTATAKGHVGAWDSVVRTAERLGCGDVFERLDPAEVAQRTGSPAHLAGVFEPMNGTIHPAKLGLGLARIARGIGVRIFENTPAVFASRGSPVRLTAPRGAVPAERAVIATNAWAAAVPELASRFICVTSAVVATPPIPERLAEIGWTGGESITDSQTTVDYYRTTRSGRIVFGKGGGRLGFTGEPGDAVFRDAGLIAAAEADFRRVYPTLADVPIERSWSGPIDRTYDSLPLIGHLAGAEHISYGVGWSGNGVNPSKIGGRILAGLALGRRERWTENGLVDRRARRFPPEPLRFLGGNLVLSAVGRADMAEIAGRRPSVIDRNLARLAPAGLEDK
jgi:glycine/D-amino acid oxidase-like deaminating enzyme